MTKSEAKWMMMNHESWVSPKLLPLKRYVGDELEFGLLEVSSGPIVFFEDGSSFEKLFAGRKTEYKSFDAIIKDGWTID